MFSRRQFLINSTGAAALAGRVHATSPTPGARISVDTARGSIPYDRMLFGQFLEHFHRQIYGGIFEPGSKLSDSQGFRLDVIEALRELRIPVVRWPGGCFASGYHWQDGVGPHRKASYDKAWRVEDPNTFGTDEFVAWCRRIGAEPYICVNAGTGASEEMSDWVEYCNLPKEGRFARRRIENGWPQPHAVKYWSIGNENYLPGELGAKTAAEWAVLVNESAKMMRRVDPSIKLLTAATPNVDWILPLLRAAGKQLDYISIHGYWDPLWYDNKPSDYLTCMMRWDWPEKRIQTAERILEIAGLEGKVAIAFDEWNLRGWHHPHGNTPEAIQARDQNDINSTYTMADAIFSAGFLNACLRHARTVRMANMAPAVNTRGPLFAHPRGIVRRTTFHVLKMYSDLCCPNVADAFVSADALPHADKSAPVLDAVVTCTSDWKTLVLTAINRHPEMEVSCSLRVDGAPLEGAFPATLLSGDSPDAYNDVERPNRVVPIERSLSFRKGVTSIPPHTLAFCRLNR
jgi:alpha-N-arabinofuranosidase